MMTMNEMQFALQNDAAGNMEVSMTRDDEFGGIKLSINGDTCYLSVDNVADLANALIHFAEHF